MTSVSDAKGLTLLVLQKLKVLNETIHAAREIDSASPTKLAENIKKLAEDTLKATHPELSVNDDSVRLKIEAQLLKLERAKTPQIVLEHKPIVLALERESLSRPMTPSRERSHKLLAKDVIYCATLMSAHGENYEEMVKDKLNVYRETTRSLQRKIRIFKESPHYQTYLHAKEDGTPLSEAFAELE